MFDITEREEKMIITSQVFSGAGGGGGGVGGYVLLST